MARDRLKCATPMIKFVSSRGNHKFPHSPISVLSFFFLFCDELKYKMFRYLTLWALTLYTAQLTLKNEKSINPEKYRLTEKQIMSMSLSGNII